MGRESEGWKIKKDDRTGIYTVRFRNGGERPHRSTGCSKKSEAAKAAKKIYAEVVGGEGGTKRVAHGDLEDLMATWLVEMDELRPGWSETLEIYANAHWLSRWSRLEELTGTAIQKYISERLRSIGRGGNKISPNTVLKELSGLKRFLTWCKRHLYIAKLPTWEAPERNDDYQSVFLSREEADAVLSELPTRDIHLTGHPVREYFTVMWATSFRKGTMARLRWEDVAWNDGFVRVRSSADKKRYGRGVPLTGAALDALRAIGPGVGLIFGERDYRASLRSAAERAGIDDERKQKLANHAIRHSRISDWASRSKNIAAIQHMAGHTTLASTMKYVHSAEENARALLDETEEPVAPSPAKLAK
jgi:integrase